MQIKIYTIPITDDGSLQEEMNKFLRSNKVIEVESQLISNEKGGWWCFCVRYIMQVNQQSPQIKAKKDYKEILSEEAFNRFNKLREIRKLLAQEDGVPAYAVFTDEELSIMSTQKELNSSTMLKISGIGEKRLERYGLKMIELCSTNKTL